jgi:hypothetical protein
VPIDAPNPSDSIDALRRFFDRRVSHEDAARAAGTAGETARRQMIRHLVERTLARASLRVRAAPDASPGPSRRALRWKRAVMTAALSAL